MTPRTWLDICRIERRFSIPVPIMANAWAIPRMSSSVTVVATSISTKVSPRRRSLFPATARGVRWDWVELGFITPSSFR